MPNSVFGCSAIPNEEGGAGVQSGRRPGQRVAEMWRGVRDRTQCPTIPASWNGLRLGRSGSSLPRMRELSTRQESIMALARDAGRVSVEALADRFEVTPQTIR